MPEQNQETDNAQSEQSGAGSGAEGELRGLGPAHDSQLVLRYIRRGDLRANPANWRTHDARQIESINQLQAMCGWTRPTLLNEATGNFLDGHGRLDGDPDEEIPVLCGRWSEEQERMIIATLDPITAMATADTDALRTLVASIEANDPEVQALVDKVGSDLEVKLLGELTAEPEGNAELQETANSEDVPPVGQPAETAEATAAPVEMLQLFFDQQTYEDFAMYAERIQAALETTDITVAILEVMRNAIQPEAAESRN